MEFRLEYCSLLEAVADRITNVNRVHGDYSTINSRGEHEQQILILIAELYKLLHEKGILISPDAYHETRTHSMRQLTFFFIINSNLSVQYDLNEDPYISKCLNKCPQMTKCVLMNLIWSLNMENFFYESVALTPHWLSLELLDAAESNIEYLEPFDFIDKIQRLIEVLYHQITRMQFVNMDENEREMILSAFVRTFLHLLNLFIIPPSDKISSWSKYKLMKYAGYCLRNVFEMTLICLKKFLTFPTKKIPKRKIIYDVKIKNASYKKSESITGDHKYHPTIHKTLSLLNTNLLDGCTANMKSITMTIYLCWAEIDDERQSGDSLQTVISNSAYELSELLKTNEGLGVNTDLLEVFKVFARKPKTLHEKIIDADLKTVIKCCSIKNNNQKAWFDKLIKSYDLSDAEVRDCFKKNVVLLDADNMSIILEKTNEILVQLKLSEEDKESVKSLVLEALKILRPIDIQIRAVQGFLISHGVINILQMKTFDTDLLQTFNKTILVDDYKLQQILGLLIQNPEKVYKKIIETCIKNSKQVEMMCSMLKTFQVIGDVRFKELTYEIQGNPLPKNDENLFLTTLLSTFDETIIEEQDILNFVKFIQNIKGFVLDSQNLVFKFLVPKIQNAIIKRDFVKSLCLLRGLFEICADKEIYLLQAPVLVVLAQVLEHSRWDLETFQNIKVQVVNAAIDAVFKLGTAFSRERPYADKAIAWLQMKLAGLKPINKIHFNALWETDVTSKEIIWKPILKQAEIGTMSRKENIAFLCEMMTRMVASEVKLIKIEDPFIICETMSALCSVVEDKINSEAAQNLLHHCFALACVMFLKMNPLPDKARNIELFEKLLDVLMSVPLQTRENCCLAIINILTSSLNKIIQDELIEEVEKRLQSKILKLDCTQAQSVLIKIMCFSKEKPDVKEEFMEEADIKPDINNIDIE